MVVYSRDRFDSVLEKAAGVDRGRVTEQALQAVPSVEVEDLRIVRDHQQSHACAKVDRWYATSRPPNDVSKSVQMARKSIVRTVREDPAAGRLRVCEIQRLLAASQGDLVQLLL